jgi:hypothetical protein
LKYECGGEEEASGTQKGTNLSSYAPLLNKSLFNRHLTRGWNVRRYQAAKQTQRRIVPGCAGPTKLKQLLTGQKMLAILDEALPVAS